MSLIYKLNNIGVREKNHKIRSDTYKISFNNRLVKRILRHDSHNHFVIMNTEVGDNAAIAFEQGDLSSIVYDKVNYYYVHKLNI